MRMWGSNSGCESRGISGRGSRGRGERECECGVPIVDTKAEVSAVVGAKVEVRADVIVKF